MADVNRGNRPLSPHLSIYRMTITMFVSIANRITGVGLGVSMILIAWWLIAAASSPDYFASVNGWMTSWPVTIILIASLWALWFHFLGGLRHIIMDFGIGYELKTVNLTGWLVVLGSFVLTAATLLCIL